MMNLYCICRSSSYLQPVSKEFFFQKNHRENEKRRKENENYCDNKNKFLNKNIACSFKDDEPYLWSFLTKTSGSRQRQKQVMEYYNQATINVPIKNSYEMGFTNNSFQLKTAI